MRRVAVVVILLCAIAACGRRKPAISAPPTAPTAGTIESVRPDIPPKPRREVAILFNNAPRYTEVVAQLRKLLPLETYHVILAAGKPMATTNSPGRPRSEWRILREFSACLLYTSDAADEL